MANVLAKSVESVVSFFGSLRSELAFYVGCLNLRSALVMKGEPVCTPVPMPAERSLVPSGWPLRPWPQSPHGRAYCGERLERRR